MARYTPGVKNESIKTECGPGRIPIAASGGAARMTEPGIPMIAVAGKHRPRASPIRAAIYSFASTLDPGRPVFSFTT